MKKYLILFFYFVAIYASATEFVCPNNLKESHRRRPHSDQTTIAEEGRVNENDIKERYKNILLVIQYNHPFYQSIPFIKELYGPYFPNIVFYGEKKDSGVTAIKTTVGVYLPRVMSDVFSKFPNFEGYIFLQDDCLMNLWNFSRLDKQKLWLAVSRYPDGQPELPASWSPGFDRARAIEGFFHAKLDGSVCESWGWWKTKHGLHPLRKAMKKLPKKLKSQLKKNIGAGNVISIWSDMFYVPGKYRKKMHLLSTLFSDVFYEISVPMMFACLDDMSNWEYLRMHWGAPQDNFVVYRNDVDWIHPIKFSSLEMREFAKSVMNEFCQTEE